MKNVIAVFRSRSETMRLKEILTFNGIRCEIISTPREAGVGCGLSLLFDGRYLKTVANGIRKNSFNTFLGFFIKTFQGVAKIDG